jgi:hypothetical protein
MRMQVNRHAARQRRLIIHMHTISRTIKIIGLAINILATITAHAEDTLLHLSSHGTQVTLKVKNHHVVAQKLGKHFNYEVSNAVSDHLIRAENAHIISDKSNESDPLFIVVSREPSRPNAMGQGYCGAGYEDYLLLIAVSSSKIQLRDKFLLQSCLKSISMLIEQGNDLDDAENGLIPKGDGSFSYRLIGDEADQERNLVVRARRFKVSLVPAKNH